MTHCATTVVEIGADRKVLVCLGPAVCISAPVENQSSPLAELLIFFFQKTGNWNFQVKSLIFRSTF